jgi:epoxyqueuosine reductase
MWGAKHLVRWVKSRRNLAHIPPGNARAILPLLHPRASVGAQEEMKVLPVQEVRAAARACGFALVGLAPAQPLDPEPLRRWLDRGYAAGLSAMQQRIGERLDPANVVLGARTVIALGIPYDKGDTAATPPAIARYARGRDYHYAHRDRMRVLRHRLRAFDPSLRTYACVDSGAAMEKAWAERAGLGFIGKNGVLITREHGSWLTLSVMVLDRAVDRYDEPHPRLCGDCEKCLAACPTGAFPSPGVVDARLCLSYHTVENHGAIPALVRERLGPRVFGCDACQEVCPFNHRGLPDGDPRQTIRPLGRMRATEIAALSEQEFTELATGTPMRRIGYHGLRRNACLALGSAATGECGTLLERLANDPSPAVSEAATWALSRQSGQV